MELGKVEKTERGFQIIHFKDRNEIKCSLQASSLAIYEKPGTSAVWLGPENHNAKVYANDAKRFGIETNKMSGWVKYPIPEDVLVSTRMHLDRDQVKSLIKHLQQWLDKDTF